MALFGKRKGRVRRILVVEDEPLIAFDNEHFLKGAGYDIVATVDSAAAATSAIGRGKLDLVLSDVRLSDGGTGMDVAAAAKARGVPVMFVTGALPPDAEALAVACLSKPYSQRDLLSAIEAVDAHLVGDAPKRLPAGLRLF